MGHAFLPDRGVVIVAGDDAGPFLHNVLTCAIEGDGPAFGALLSPQGKILFDALIAQKDGVFHLDTALAHAADFARRLSFYKLRAKVTVEDASTRYGIVASWSDAPRPLPAPGPVFLDPRLDALGWRAVTERAAAEAAPGDADAAYHAHRLDLMVPEGGRDYAFGDTFPHEADMDQLHGIDFKKGCYVGQEVVSRMEHRGTARTRIVGMSFSGPAPAAGAEVLAGDKTAGRVGSAADRHGLALLRLDRVADALAEGRPVTVEGHPAMVTVPPWARFSLPGT